MAIVLGTFTYSRLIFFFSVEVQKKKKKKFRNCWVSKSLAYYTK